MEQGRLSNGQVMWPRRWRNWATMMTSETMAGFWGGLRVTSYTDLLSFVIFWRIRFRGAVGRTNGHRSVHTPSTSVQ